MGKVTRTIEHVDVDKLITRIDHTKNAAHARKLPVIWNATVDPRPAEEIAVHCGVARQTVHNWISTYNRFGLDALLGPGKGGRRNEWRKLMPRPRHVGAKKEAQEEFKKTFPNK